MPQFTMWPMSLVRASPYRPALLRWMVHLGLIGFTITSLVFEPVLILHVVLGLAFALLVGIHLAVRRRVSKRLAVRLLKILRGLLPADRLALADGLLFIITSAMLVSGFWDLWAAHHTKIRWHAITGVVLTIYIAVHTARRWGRLRFSKIR